MNKSRQKELTRWLKQQSVISQRWLNISRLLGFVSGILIIAQAWFMARILQHMIMENIPREALLPFTLLVLTFVLRAWVVWLRERVGYHAGQHIRFAIRRQFSTVCNKQGQRGFRVNLRGAGRRWYSSKLTICMITMHAICRKWRWQCRCRC
nr:htrD [Escherichia coli]